MSRRVRRQAADRDARTLEGHGLQLGLAAGVRQRDHEDGGVVRDDVQDVLQVGVDVADLGDLVDGSLVAYVDRACVDDRQGTRLDRGLVEGVHLGDVLRDGAGRAGQGDGRAGADRGGAVARGGELVPEEAELRGVAGVGGRRQVVRPAVDVVSGDRRHDRAAGLRRRLVGDRDVAGPVSRAAPGRGDRQPAVDGTGRAIDRTDRELGRPPGLRHGRQRRGVLGAGVAPGEPGHADHHDGSGGLGDLVGRAPPRRWWPRAPATRGARERSGRADVLADLPRAAILGGARVCTRCARMRRVPDLSPAWRLRRGPGLQRGGPGRRHRARRGRHPRGGPGGRGGRRILRRHR